MTISRRTPGAWTDGSTSLSPALPASIAAGDLMILFVGCKPYSATISDISGWTRLGTQQTNGTTANSADAGSVAWTVFYRIYQNGDGSPSVSITSGNTALACIHGYSRTKASWVLPTAYFGSDTSSGTGYSITAASSSGKITVGDEVIHFTFIPGNNVTLGTPTITATNATFGTVTESPSTEGTTNTGLDCEASSAVASCTAGTSTADAVCGWTLSGSQTGGSALVVVREGYEIDVTKADLSTTGTTLTIERMADQASLETTGQTVGMIEIATLGEAALSTSGSTITIEGILTEAEASISTTGQTFDMIVTLPVVEATPSISTSTLTSEQILPSIQSEPTLSGQDVVLTAIGNYTSALVDFDTPADPPLTGVDEQRFRVLVRKTSAANPTVDIWLYEAGSPVVQLITEEEVTSGTGQIITAYWNASSLSDSTGADVQCYIYGTKVSGSAVEIGAVVWESRASAATVIDVDHAALSVDGQTITWIAVCNVTPTDLSSSGSFVGQDVVFSFSAASLSSSGSTVTDSVTLTQVHAELSSTGSTITGTEILTVGESAASVQGQDVTSIETFSPDAASVSTQGQSVTGIVILTTGEASLSTSGQTVDLYKGITLDVTSAALSTEGQTVTGIEILNPTEASLTTSGQDVFLGVGKFIGVDNAALSTQGTTITIERMADPASLSISGQTITAIEIVTLDAAALSTQGQAVTTIDVAILGHASLTTQGSTVTGIEVATVGKADLATEGQIVVLDKTGGTIISLDVVSASLSTQGTTLTITRVADPASLSVSGSVVTFDTSRSIDVQPAALIAQGKTATFQVGPDYVNVTRAALTTQGQWVDTIQDRNFDTAEPVITPSDITWIFGVEVVPAAFSASGSDLTFIHYTSATVNVDSGSALITGQDVQFNVTGPLPQLQVEQANLEVVGQNVVLAQPPAQVEAAALQITGQDILMIPGLGNIANVDTVYLGLEGSEVTFTIEGSFTMNVTNAALTLEGVIIGLIKDILVTSNRGKIDGAEEYVINDESGMVIMYPRDGGYFTISKG